MIKKRIDELEKNVSRNFPNYIAKKRKNKICNQMSKKWRTKGIIFTYQKEKKGYPKINDKHKARNFKECQPG